MVFTITIRSTEHIQFLNITEKIKEVVKEREVREGICLAYVPHTTAGITINESADPAVPADIVSKLNELVPRDENYRHAEGNSDAHIKTLLTGNSVTIPISQGLVLGRWQAVFFCEYDGPRTRKIFVSIIKSNA